MVVRQSRRSFVDRVNFVTSVGFGDGPGSRERLGLAGAGPRKVITDLGILEPDPVTCGLTLTGLYPGVTVADAAAKTGCSWPCRIRWKCSSRPPRPSSPHCASCTAGPSEPDGRPG